MGVFIISILLWGIWIDKIGRIRVNIPYVHKVGIQLFIGIGIILYFFFLYPIKKDELLFIPYVWITFVYIAYIDIRYYLILDEYNLVIFTLSCIRLTYLHLSMLNFVMATFVFFSIMIIEKWIEKKVKKEGLGSGDLKLFIAMAGYLGIQKNLLAIFLASIFALFGEGVKICMNRKKQMIPFGPYLALGYMTLILYLFV